MAHLGAGANATILRPSAATALVGASWRTQAKLLEATEVLKAKTRRAGVARIWTGASARSDVGSTRSTGQGSTPGDGSGPHGLRFYTRGPTASTGHRRSMSVEEQNTKDGESAVAEATAGAPSSAPPLVMQIVVERRLVKDPNWSLGPLMAQAAHAAIAVVAQTLSKSSTREYISPAALASMHKVVLVTPANSSLEELSRKLHEAEERERSEEGKRKAAAGQSGGREADEVAGDFPAHHLWYEQPENVATCLAIEPNRKPAALKKVLNKCRLLREGEL